MICTRTCYATSLQDSLVCTALAAMRFSIHCRVNTPSDPKLVLSAGNSVFFTVKRIEDPIGLLPAKLILGINKRGVHFFRPVPKEYLHSAELRDIMQFGSSSQAVFFKMRVAGVLHIFQFDTKQGEDICMALQTHINDIMMKRYSKVSFVALLHLCLTASCTLPVMSQQSKQFAVAR